MSEHHEMEHPNIPGAAPERNSGTSTTEDPPLGLPIGQQPPNPNGSAAASRRVSQYLAETLAANAPATVPATATVVEALNPSEAAALSRHPSVMRAAANAVEIEAKPAEEIVVGDDGTVSHGSVTEDDRQSQQTWKTSSSMDVSNRRNRHGCDCLFHAIRNSLYVHMLMLLLVPVAFLVGYSSEGISASVRTITFGSTQRDALHWIVECGHAIMSERGFSGAVGSPAATAAAWATLYTGQAVSDTACNNAFQNIKQNSDGLGSGPLDELRHNMLTVERIRTLVEQKNSSMTVSLVEQYADVIEKIASIIDAYSKHPDAGSLREPLSLLMFSRRMQNWIGNCRATGNALISAGGPPVESGIRQLHQSYAAATFAWTTLLTTGTDETKAFLVMLDSNVTTAVWHTYLNIMLTGNYTLTASLTVATYAGAFTLTLNLLKAHDQVFLDTITNGDAPRQQLLQQTVELVCAVVVIAALSTLVMIRRHRIQQQIEDQLGHSRALNRAVARFVPANQLRAMGVRSITEVNGGDHVEVAQSLLFADIRGFTWISETKTNTQLFDWLQEYFDVMSKVTTKHCGFIDKFIGDAVFSVFNSATRAVECAIAMHTAADNINNSLTSRREKDHVHIGVGVHHGLVCCGVFGDRTRLTCTLVSRDVNMASRLEGATKQLGARTLVSSAVATLIDTNAFDIRFCGEILVKGSHKPQEIFEIFQNDALDLKEFKTNTKERFERALRLRKSQPGASFAILAALKDEAAASEVEDLAVAAHFEQLQGEGPDCTSFLQQQHKEADEEVAESMSMNEHNHPPGHLNSLHVSSPVTPNSPHSARIPATVPRAAC